MPTLRLRIATLLTSLELELTLARPLLFPEVTCLARGADALPSRLAARIREIVRSSETADVHRRRGARLPELSTVQVEVPALRERPERGEPVSLEFTLVRWRHGADAAIAYVPALDIEILAEDDERLETQLRPQILAELGRRQAAVSVRDLVYLERLTRATVRPLLVGVTLPTVKQATLRARDDSPDRGSVLKEIASNLAQSTAPPIYERDELLRQLTELVAGSAPRSVLLVGPSGAGKSALVFELTGPRRPAALADRPCWSTSGSRIVAGQSGYGMWQQRCQQLVREARRTRALLHLGNFIELMETGKGGGSTTGIAALLRPALADGALQAIAECTPEELATVERENPRFLEAFTILDVPATTQTQTRALLARQAEALAARRGPRISPAALDEVERLHRRYATYSAAPGRVVRFLQNLLADAPHRRHARSPAAVHDEPCEPSDVIAAFSRETGLPLRMLDDRIPLVLEEVRGWLAERVLGQSRPVELVTDLLAAVKSSLARAGKPLASFLFIGPTGVGKTEMAKALAEFLYQDPGRMIRFDMSEYATPAAVERLVGGPDGSPGRLTQEVRDQPFMVVLLDEFEKAHPQAFDMLLQVLGEGRLTDARGRVADFTNAVVIMTSNLGAESFRPHGVGFAGEERAAATADEHFERVVRDFLRPELFNRIDRIVPFAPLDRALIATLARREVTRLAGREGLRLRAVDLDVSPAAASWLALRGYDPRYGARPLKRIVERHLVAPLAERLCRYGPEVLLRCRVDVAEDRLTFDMTATPRGVGASTAQTDVVREVQALRREAARVAGSGALLRCRNEIERLRQLEAQRKRVWRRKHRRPGDDEAPPPYSFTPAQANVLAHERLLANIDSLLAEIRQFEDVTLEASYAEQPLAVAEIEATRRALDASFREAVLQLHLALNPSHGILTIAVFGESRERIRELTDAYERLARRNQAMTSRFSLFIHDPKLLAAGEAKQRKPGDPPGPVLRLLHRKESSESPICRTLDVYPATADTSDRVAGLAGFALQIRSAHVALLLETEGGAHEFVDATGRSERCWVETTSDRLVAYEPPADAGRAGAFRELRLRRVYDFARGQCRDLTDQERVLELRGDALDAACEAAAQAEFGRRLGRAFE